MADALPLTPLLLFALLIVVAAAPAAAKPRMPNMQLHSFDAVRLDEPARAQHDPVLGRHLFADDGATLSNWGLPFGPSPGDRDRRGLSFSVRPHHGLRATAKFRF